MGSVCLLPRAPPCHLKRPLCEEPVREGKERDQPAGRHQRARRNAAVEEEAGRKRAGGEREHESPELGGGDASADGVRDQALQQRRAAGPEDAAASVAQIAQPEQVLDLRAGSRASSTSSGSSEKSATTLNQSPVCDTALAAYSVRKSRLSRRTPNRRRIVKEAAKGSRLYSLRWLSRHHARPLTGRPSSCSASCAWVRSSG